jgi:hypothetical protein
MDIDMQHGHGHAALIWPCSTWIWKKDMHGCWNADKKLSPALLVFCLQCLVRHRHSSILILASTFWHRHSGIGNTALAFRHWPSGIGIPASAFQHQHSSIGIPASAFQHRHSGIVIPESAFRHRHSGIMVSPVPLVMD